jgi:phage FluMu protein gp41
MLYKDRTTLLASRSNSPTACSNLLRRWTTFRGAVYTVFSEDELRSLTEDLQRLKASEKSFEFWDNPEDAIYDTL